MCMFIRIGKKNVLEKKLEVAAKYISCTPSGIRCFFFLFGCHCVVV